jgi:hypothetical protein
MAGIWGGAEINLRFLGGAKGYCVVRVRIAVRHVEKKRGEEGWKTLWPGSRHCCAAPGPPAESENKPHSAILQHSNGKVADRDWGSAQRLWWLAAAQCARELEKGVENAHPRAPRRRPSGARICCDKFRRIRRAQSSGSRRVATEFK